jgi:ubiquinone biosynthesis protein UbiJ
MKRALLSLIVCLGLPACATTQAVDPRQDQGLFSTISGVSGGYSNHTADQLRELDTEEQALRRNQATRLSQGRRADALEAELVALQSSVSSVRSNVDALNARITSSQDAASANTREIGELTARLAELATASRRLNVAANAPGADVDALTQDRDRLLSELEQLQDMARLLGF